MRILVLDQYGERGGAQNCLVDAVRGFRSRGWKIHALVPKGPLLDSLRPFCASARALSTGASTPAEKPRGTIVVRRSVVPAIPRDSSYRERA